MSNRRARARKIEPSDSTEVATVDEQSSDVDVIDVEAEEVSGSLGRWLTPWLPPAEDDAATRVGQRRVDALSLGDEVVAPVTGFVTGLFSTPDGVVEVYLDGDAVPYLVGVDELCEVVLPQWRPGELGDQVVHPWKRPEVAVR